MTKKEVNAAILIIGSEILSGRTKDLNTSTISSWLNTIGIKVIESRTVLDVENQIISNLKELKSRYNYVFNLINNTF